MPVFFADGCSAVGCDSGVSVRGANTPDPEEGSARLAVAVRRGGEPRLKYDPEQGGTGTTTPRTEECEGNPHYFSLLRIVPAMQNGTAVQAAVTPQELVLFLARGPGPGSPSSCTCVGQTQRSTATALRTEL